jgi:hypothetical protein
MNFQIINNFGVKQRKNTSQSANRSHPFPPPKKNVAFEYNVQETDDEAEKRLYMQKTETGDIKLVTLSNQTIEAGKIRGIFEWIKSIINKKSADIEALDLSGNIIDYSELLYARDLFPPGFTIVCDVPYRLLQINRDPNTVGVFCCSGEEPAPTPSPAPDEEQTTTPEETVERGPPMTMTMTALMAGPATTVNADATVFDLRKFLQCHCGFSTKHGLWTLPPTALRAFEVLQAEMNITAVAFHGDNDFWLSECQCRKDVTILMRFLKKLPNLVSIDLKGNEISDAFIAAISAGLSDDAWGRMLRLNLSYNRDQANYRILESNNLPEIPNAKNLVLTLDIQNPKPPPSLIGLLDFADTFELGKYFYGTAGTDVPPDAL